VADFYTSISATAKRLIGTYGKTVKISRDTGGTFNPVTGNYSGTSVDSQNVTAVVLPANKSKVAGLDVQYGLGGLTFKKYNFMIVSGEDVTFTPEPGHTVTIDTVDWVVLGVTPTNPNDGSPIVYDVALRI
jgi:hypothetical protein